MRKKLAAASIVIGAALLLPPVILVLGPVFARLFGVYSIGLNVDYHGVVLMLSLAVLGTAILTSGIWMLAARPAK